MAFNKNSTIFIFYNCSVKKILKYYENVRSSDSRGHRYAGCVKFFNYLDKKNFVEASELFFM